MVLLTAALFPNASLRFGERVLSTRIVQEQLCLYTLTLFPLGCILGQLSIRLAVRCPFAKHGADLWNAAVRLLLADLLMEMLLPSLQCIPLPDEETWYEWTVQSFGIGCPLYAQQLTPTSMAALFLIRVVVLSIGLGIGESWCPIGLTGGIATGKSTVADQLVNGMLVVSETGNDGSSHVDGDDKKQPTTSSTATDSLTPAPEQQQQRMEIDVGTVCLVDTDKIGHDILLKDSRWSVHAKIVSTFGKDVLSDNGEIDRTKLGAKIFADPQQRKRLNGITHPRIVSVMLQQLWNGLYYSIPSWRGRTEYCHLVMADVPLLMESPWFVRMFFVLKVMVTCTAEQELERLQKHNPELSRDHCQQRIAAQMPLAAKEKRANVVIRNDGTRKDLAVAVEHVRRELMDRIHGIGFKAWHTLMLLGVLVPLSLGYKLYDMQQHAE